MKRLFLVRHAKTELLDSGKTDFERRLKGRGHSDARLMADYLKKNGYLPDVIVSSDARRAIQTATNMASIFGIEEDQIVQTRFIYSGFEAGELLAKLQRVARGKNSMMIVGHNPDIALAAMQLSSGNFFHFPTAAVAVIKFEGDEWNEVGDKKGVTELFISPREVKEKD